MGSGLALIGLYPQPVFMDHTEAVKGFAKAVPAGAREPACGFRIVSYVKFYLLGLRRME